MQKMLHIIAIAVWVVQSMSTREANALTSHPIDIWRGNLTAITAEVTESNIIHHNQNDVGSRGLNRSTFAARNRAN